MILVAAPASDRPEFAYLSVCLVLRDVKQQAVLPLTVQRDVHSVDKLQQGVHAASIG